jgi:hypothetical protein
MNQFNKSHSMNIFPTGGKAFIPNIKEANSQTQKVTP